MAGFDAYVAKAVKDWSTPGLAVAVVKGDSVVFAKGYGVRTLGSRRRGRRAHAIRDRLHDEGLHLRSP